MADHDHSYKLLFSQPEMVDHLLVHLAHREKWIGELDLPTLAPVPAHRLSGDLRERENDVVWRVRWQGRWLYLMIEFQSSDDKWMALRAMAYQALLYQDLIRQERAGRPGDLPAAAVIVLYNGEEAWKAAQQISELIGKAPVGLRGCIPSLRFLLIDIGRLRPSEMRQKGNLAVHLYRLERSSSPKQVERELQSLFEELGRPGRSELRRAFLTWLRRVRLPSRFPGLEFPILRQEDKSAMLEERVQKWTENWKAEGRRECAAATLIQLLEDRFGSLAARYRKRISAADISKLQQWTRRILRAGQLEEVFDPPGSGSQN